MLSTEQLEGLKLLKTAFDRLIPMDTDYEVSYLEERFDIAFQLLDNIEGFEYELDSVELDEGGEEIEGYFCFDFAHPLIKRLIACEIKYRLESTMEDKEIKEKQMIEQMSPEDLERYKILKAKESRGVSWISENFLYGSMDYGDDYECLRVRHEGQIGEKDLLEAMIYYIEVLEEYVPLLEKYVVYINDGE